LLSENKIKAMGRTQAGGNGILADWSGAGFEINVSGGGAMSVGYYSNYETYWVIFVDNIRLTRIRAAASSAGTISFTVPDGSHTIGVIKDTQIQNNASGYCDLTTLSYDGTIHSAPANKELYIEFIGDSYSCGDGAAAKYEPGVQWSNADHAATQSFPWYTAKALNADYSIIARGGIGLFVGISEQEGTANKTGMQDIYSYTSGYRTSAGAYSFTRQPDVIVVELGANDGLKSGSYYTSIEYWTELLESFTDQVRSKNPNAKIVFLSHNAVKHKAMMSVVEARKSTDPNLSAFFFSHNGNGSAALATQQDGHPSADDHKQLADALVKYFKYADIITEENITPTYNDLPYYVSQNGNDSNSGTAIGSAKATVQAAINQAVADHPSFNTNDRVVIYVQGTVTNSEDSVIADMNGGRVPVLITTYAYNGTNAVISTGHSPVDDADSAIVFGSNVTLKNITLLSETAGTGYRDRYLYAGYNDIILDNVTFSMGGSTPSNNSGWIVSAGHPTGSNAPATQVSSSITFQNGDYTTLSSVTAMQSSASIANVDCRIIVEDGAAMGAICNRYGTGTARSIAVEIHGGTVQQYVGTNSGTSSARIIYTGNVDFIMSGGTVYGASFATTGKYVTINGDINNNISGGVIYITPQTSTNQYDAYFFGGGQGASAQNVNTTISAGTFYVVTNMAGTDTGFYFGPSGGTVKNVTNTISGGSFLPMAGTSNTATMSICMGPHTGTITGTLRNEISAATFSFDAASKSGAVIFGSRGANIAIGNMVNILGKEGSEQGPRFYNCTVHMGGTWSQVGRTSKLTADPAPSTSSDKVAISNTIHNGYFTSYVYCGPTSATDTSRNLYSFVAGSIENKVYGGHFINNFYAGGNANVYGRVSTEIHGGHFENIYGGNYKNNVYDGVALTIYDLIEYGPVSATSSWKLFVGGTNCNIYTQTSGRDALTLTLDGETCQDLNLQMPIAALENNSGTDGIVGNTRVVLKCATLNAIPNGFNIVDVALSDNDTAHLNFNGTVNAESVSGNGTLILNSGTSVQISESASGQINCSVNGEVSDDHIYLSAPSGTDIDTFRFSTESGVLLSTGSKIEWTTGAVSYSHVSISGPSGSKGYDTLEDAIAAYTGEENSYIVLWKNIDHTVTVTKPITLDLNGYRATINLSGSGAVYGMDASGNTFVEPTGVLTITNGSAETVSEILGSDDAIYRYIALSDGNKYTFHRFSVDTSIGLRPFNESHQSIGLYYKPTFLVDASLAEAIAQGQGSTYDFGVLVTINKDGTLLESPTSISDYCTLSANSRNDSMRVIVYNLTLTNQQISSRTNQDGTDCSNMTEAAFIAAYDLSKYKITGQTYIQVNGQKYLDDANATISLREAVKKADGLYPNYKKGSAEKTALDTMWKKYSTIINKWFSGSNALENIGNIKIDISDWFK